MSSDNPPDAQYPPGPQGGQGPQERPEDATMPGGGDQQPVRLRMQLGATIGQVYTMVGTKLTLGRAQDNDVALDDPQVSRYHAQVMRQGNQTRITCFRVSGLSIWRWDSILR